MSDSADTTRTGDGDGRRVGWVSARLRTDFTCRYGNGTGVIRSISASGAVIEKAEPLPVVGDEVRLRCVDRRALLYLEPLSRDTKSALLSTQRSLYTIAYGPTHGENASARGARSEGEAERSAGTQARTKSRAVPAGGLAPPIPG